MKTPVISPRNLPTVYPVTGTMLTIIGLNSFNAPLWAWLAAAWIYLLVWLLTLIKIRKESQVDVFPDQPSKAEPIRDLTDNYEKTTLHVHN